MRVYVHTYACLDVCVYVCARECVHLYVCVYVCVCVCACAHEQAIRWWISAGSGVQMPKQSNKRLSHVTHVKSCQFCLRKFVTRVAVHG
jgi:hypothetical protein